MHCNSCTEKNWAAECIRASSEAAQSRVREKRPLREAIDQQKNTWLIHPFSHPSIHSSFIHWFMGPIHRLPNLLSHWCTDSFIHWFAGLDWIMIDSLSHRFHGFDILIYLSTHWWIDALNRPFIRSLVHWLIDSLAHWSIDLIHRLSRSLIHWFVGSIIDSLVHWFIPSVGHAVFPRSSHLYFWFPITIYCWMILKPLFCGSSITMDDWMWWGDDEPFGTRLDHCCPFIISVTDRWILIMPKTLFYRLRANNVRLWREDLQCQSKGYPNHTQRATSCSPPGAVCHGPKRQVTGRGCRWHWLRAAEKLGASEQSMGGWVWGFPWVPGLRASQYPTITEFLMMGHWWGNSDEPLKGISVIIVASKNCS